MQLGSASEVPSQALVRLATFEPVLERRHRRQQDR
jgi:hypothetical protein